MGFHGDFRDYMGFHGIPWNPVVMSPWSPTESSGTYFTFLFPHRIPWGMGIKPG